MNETHNRAPVIRALVGMLSSMETVRFTEDECRAISRLTISVEDLQNAVDERLLTAERKVAERQADTRQC